MKTAYDYMIALTADERTPSVKAMVDIILLDAAKEIDEALKTPTNDYYKQLRGALHDAYTEGHDDGYSKGYVEGHEEGYDACTKSVEKSA